MNIDDWKRRAENVDISNLVKETSADDLIALMIKVANPEKAMNAPTYHKIQTVWNRDPDNNHKTLIDGDWARDEFDYLAGDTWLGTEKVDGMNIRVIWDGEKVKFRGRTDKAELPTTLMLRLEERFNPSDMAEHLKGPCVLYGEGFGPRIQKGGGNYGSSVDFALFDVWSDVWLTRESMCEIAISLDVQMVPPVYIGGLGDAIKLCQKGFKSWWGDFEAEGLVLRPQIELLDRMGRRIITKIKLKDFAREVAS